MVQQIGVRDLDERLRAKHALLLLDVRQPWEHETAALPGSMLIPLDELPSRADEIEVPEGATIIAYCHHGVRSLSAAAILERMGFANVASLRGGIDAWSIHVDPSVPRY